MITQYNEMTASELYHSLVQFFKYLIEIQNQSIELCYSFLPHYCICNTSLTQGHKIHYYFIIKTQIFNCEYEEILFLNQCQLNSHIFHLVLYYIFILIFFMKTNNYTMSFYFYTSNKNCKILPYHLKNNIFNIFTNKNKSFFLLYKNVNN